MTQESTATVMEAGAPPAEDLLAAIQRVLQASDEPLTVPKLRARLPGAHREANLEEVLQRQVTANVLIQYPRYRSQQDRYWDRPMPVHVAALVEASLQEGPMSRSDVRRKLPAYAQSHSETVIQDLLQRGRLHVHPRAPGRGSERIGVRPADPKDYLRPELDAAFARLQPLGFTIDQVRAAAIEMLHEQEWAYRPARTRGAEAAVDGTPTSTETPDAPPTPAESASQG